MDDSINYGGSDQADDRITARKKEKTAKTKTEMISPEKVVTKPAKRWRTFKGLLTRTIFIAHGIVSFYLLYSKNNLKLIHLLLIIPLGCLFIEGIITLCLRRGKEAKYFWPCGFFYIATIVPIIWISELDLLSQRQTKRKTFNSTIHAKTKTKSEDDMLSYVLSLADELDGRKVAEIGVIIGVILGRWLSPRASMSREQLSNLLLGYVANAADILELFESLTSPNVIYASDVTIGVLAVYTWSLLQFTLITTAYDNDERGDKYDNPNAQKIETPSSSKYGKKVGCCGCCIFHPEFLTIFVTLLMQDGPFFILRLTLCVMYKVTTELHIFFMCKNGIVIILLIYRLLILGTQNEQKFGSRVNEKPYNRANDEVEVQNIGLDNPAVEVVVEEKENLVTKTRDVGTDCPVFDLDHGEEVNIILSSD